MAMAIDWTGTAAVATEDREDGRERLRADATLRRLLDRHDDRLLRDAGLAREDVSGPEETFRREWARHRALWSL